MFDKWILLSGGSRGIGRGIVEHLSKKYKVVFTYKSSEDKANELVRLGKENDLNIEAHQCDVTDSEQVSKLSANLLGNYGAPYAIINNAGVTKDNLFINMTDEDWEKVVSSNLDSIYIFSKPFVSEMMASREGSVINISSIVGSKGNPGQTNYAATKAASIGLTKSLALEMAPFNIRVNCVSPGVIQTDLVENIPEKELVDLKKRIPMKKIGKVDDISRMVEFLIGPGGDYITGQNFTVDGGFSC